MLEPMSTAVRGEAGPMPSPPEAGATVRQPRRSSPAAIHRTAFGLWAAMAVGPRRARRIERRRRETPRGGSTREAEPPSEVR